MTILITGAEGFVGRHLRSALAHVDVPSSDIVLGVRPEDAAADARDGMRRLKFDVADARATLAAFAGTHIDAVIHLAAISAPSEARADRARAWAVNFGGVVNIVEALRASASRAKFVFAGSSEAYGESFRHISGPVPESAALNPTTVYAATKAAADVYLGQCTHDGVDALRFRAFNHTGAGQGDAFAAPAFARQIAEAEAGLRPPEVRVGNLDAERDFVDVRDVARAYAAALSAPLQRGEASAVNLCSGKPLRIGDLLERMLSAAKTRIKVEIDADRVRPNEIPRAVGDNARARALLGWAPVIPIEETILSVLDDWRRRVAAS